MYDFRRLKLKRIRILFITAVSLLFLFSCTQDKHEAYSAVTFALGDVLCNDKPVEIGDSLREMDVIKTAAGSFCDVRIGESIIRIKENSTVSMTNFLSKAGKSDTVLGLAIGKMLCKPKKLLKSEKFMVKTPTAVAGVRGTNFIVETDKRKTTRIKVFGGKVKVAKRIKQLEGREDEVLAVAPVLDKEKKVIITEKDVKKTEKKIQAAIKKSEASGEKTDTSALIKKVIVKNKKSIGADASKIKTFAVADFGKDNREIIDISEKKPAVIRKIVKALKEEKLKPRPEGRLLITRYEIYFIKSGKVVWEGSVVNSPVTSNGKIFIASGDYVFCAADDGPVLWKKKIPNSGKLELRENHVTVYTEGGTASLDAETGEKL